MVTWFILNVLIQTTTAQFGNCQWGDFTLQGAQGYEIQCVEGEYSFAYTPCMSYALCQGSRYQAVYFSRNTGICENYLAEWDDGATAPLYSKPDDISQWTFYYENGGSCGGSTPVQFDITWICDPSSLPFSLQTTCSKIDDCKYEMAVKSAYACVEGPTTTPAPTPSNSSCEWSDGNNNVLDLTSIQGFILNKVSDNDGSQIYSLSVCSNNIDCNGEMGMTTIGSISNCIQNIARWDGGVTQPRYSSNFGGQWQFVYTNGDECSNGPASVVQVFWNCDQFAGTGRITAAKQIGTCSFEIQIDSNLACGSSLISTNGTFKVFDV